jgi:hypothetical protein
MAIRHQTPTYAGITPSTTFDPTAYNTTGNIVYTGSGHSITDNPLDFKLTPTPQPSRCAKGGHTMGDESEYADGSIVGTCTKCGEVIRGRRMAGGLGTAAMRAAMIRLLEGDGDIQELSRQILNLGAVLDLEELQLREARALLRTAEKMLLQRRHNSAA